MTIESQEPETQMPESLQLEPGPVEPQAPQVVTTTRNRLLRVKSGLALKALFLLIVFVIGFGGGFFTGRQSMQSVATDATSEKKTMTMPNMEEINPSSGYKIPLVLGDIGPQMLAVGAIDLPILKELYKQVGKPTDEDMFKILTTGSKSSIVITQKNAAFLLNFFWAFGLTNKNAILTEGTMTSRGKDQVGNFASTGGWTLGKKPPMDLYASYSFLPLSEDQQARLVKVASAVYRPCCDNPTDFPDCNHGMAMLGLLEMMAAKNASEEEMFNAAKYVNAYWFPQQTLEIATLFKASQNVSFSKANAPLVVSREYSSGTGFRNVHQWMGENGLLEQTPNGGGSCGVQ